MKKILLFLLFIPIIAIPAWLGSVSQWPVKNLEQHHISSTFGESRGDHFHTGVDIAKYRAKIYPIKNGELIFYLDPSESFYPEEAGTGKTIIIQHGKKRSYYSHMDSIVKFDSFLISKNKMIGTIGNSGRSTGPHLHFSVTEKNRYLNPQLILPRLKDKLAPEIGSFYFKAGYYRKKIKIKSNYRVALPLRKSYEMLIHTFDSSAKLKRRKRMVKYIHLSIFDSKKRRILNRKIFFDYTEQGKLSGKHEFKNLYKKVWNLDVVSLGFWKKKKRKEIYRMNIEVSDYSGNITTLKKQVYFR